MLTLNPTTLSAVVDQAIQAAADHPRWLTAINRAVTELMENPYVSRQDGHLLIASPSGQIYSANGICQCIAFTGIDPKTGTRVHQGGQPCWHRAAARLVRLHDERQAEAEHQAALVQAAERVSAVVDQSADATKARWAKAQAEIEELYT